MLENRNTIIWAIAITILIIGVNNKFQFVTYLSSNENMDLPFSVKYSSLMHSKLDTINLLKPSISKSYELNLTAKNHNGEVYKFNPHEKFTLSTYNINSNIYFIPSRINMTGSFKIPNNVEFERLEKLRFYFNKENLINSEVELCYHTKKASNVYLNRPPYSINPKDVFISLNELINESHIDTIEFWQPQIFNINRYEITVCRLIEFKQTKNKVIVSINKKDKFKDEYFDGRVMIEEKGNITDTIGIENLVSKKIGILNVY